MRDAETDPDRDVTYIYPIFAIDDWDLESEEEMSQVTPSVSVHLDDCDCNFCCDNRGSILLDTTILVEVKSPYVMKSLRLTVEEAKYLASELNRFAETSDKIHNAIKTV